MNDTENVKFGFKRVTVENWNSPDPILESFFGLDVEIGEFKNTSGSNYAAIIIQNELTDKVPEEVRALYYIARNIFLYGIYFYPLYTVGINEISRVMETAISEKCQILSAPSGRKTWKEKMDWRKAAILAERPPTCWTVSGCGEIVHPMQNGKLFSRLAHR